MYEQERYRMRQKSSWLNMVHTCTQIHERLVQKGIKFKFTVNHYFCLDAQCSFRSHEYKELSFQLSQACTTERLHAKAKEK